ncbi:MAG: cell division protein [Pseudomonadales bacterium]|nr:cell division protein [Pseudomonadales bacterium]
MTENRSQPDYSGRYYLVLAGFVLLVLMVVGRLVCLQVESQDFLQDQGDRRVVRVENVPAYRGLIADRNGEPLAVSTPVTTLWFNPQELIEAQYAWPFLAQKTGVKESSLKNRILRNQDRQFIYLRRHMNPTKAEEVLAMGVPGVYAVEEHRRYYPAGEVTSHLVGFTNIDEVGQEGIELSFEQFLKGEPGKKRVIKDLRRRIVKDVGLIRPAAPGNDITLSIDLRAQYLAYRELLSAVTEYKASAGTAVAIDIATGEVLALVNQPSYNPNNRDPDDVPNFRNRALTDVFEPGSTVKPFTVAAALASGKWKPYSKVDTSPGYLRIGSKTIRDMSNYQVIDLGTIIAKSSNVGASKLALSLEPDYLARFFHKMGLGEATGVGFPGESVGMLPARQKWRPIELATLSYGYGLSVTALQLAQAYATLGSGGIKRPVSLLKVDGTVPGERVLDETVARQVVQMMEGVVDEHGTAKRARVPGYRVAGKTGTVHKVAASGYQDHRYLALFAGVAPVEDPAIALVVVIDDPKGDMYYGGLVAAPVFSRVMAGLLRVKNIPPDKAFETYVGISRQSVPRS